MALTQSNSTKKVQADAAVDKLIKYSTENPYAEKIEKQAAAVAEHPTFTYTAAKPTYTGRYTEKLDEAVKAVEDMPAFTYDAQSDPNYQALAKTYTREGERATEDALGRAAAANGGAVSTAGVTAATQAGQYYASQLADKIPALYEAAYARHLDEYNRRLDKVNLYNTMENIDYSRNRDAVSDWQTERAFQYGADADQYARKLDTLGLYRTLDTDKYARLQNAAALRTQQEETEYSRRLNDINTALGMWEQYGYATQEVADVLGVPVGTKTSGQKYSEYKAALDAAAATKEKYNALGFPTIYEDYYEEAIKSNDGSDEGKRKALAYMYNIAYAEDTNDLMSKDDFGRLLQMANLTWDDFNDFVEAYESRTEVVGPETMGPLRSDQKWG